MDSELSLAADSIRVTIPMAASFRSLSHKPIQLVAAALMGLFVVTRFVSLLYSDVLQVRRLLVSWSVGSALFFAILNLLLVAVIVFFVLFLMKGATVVQIDSRGVTTSWWIADRHVIDLGRTSWSRVSDIRTEPAGAAGRVSYLIRGARAFVGRDVDDTTAQAIFATMVRLQATA